MLTREHGRRGSDYLEKRIRTVGCGQDYLGKGGCGQGRSGPVVCYPICQDLGFLHFRIALMNQFAFLETPVG